MFSKFVGSLSFQMILFSDYLEQLSVRVFSLLFSNAYIDCFDMEMIRLFDVAHMSTHTCRIQCHHKFEITLVCR